MKVLYRQSASDDVLRQFRYYLVAANLPEVAVRFRDAVQRTVQSLRQHPIVGPRYSSSNPQLQNLRSWPLAGFEACRSPKLLQYADLVRVTMAIGRPICMRSIRGDTVALS